MARTRAAILDAAADCVAEHGLRGTTMSRVSAAGRVAKATLYNHFRTKDDLLDALALTRVHTLGAQCDEVAVKGLAGALELAAGELATCAPLRRAVRDGLVVVPGQGRVWDAARGAVSCVLRTSEAPSDDASTDLVLRWVLAQATWPGSRDEVALGARVLEDGLGRAPVERTPEFARGLGWPG